MQNHKIMDHLKLMLCPPGQGVYTISTGTDVKKRLYQKLFQTDDFQTVSKKWGSEFENNLKNNVHILGIPSDCGGGILRGANWGPLFIREHLKKDYYQGLSDLGDVRVIPHLLSDSLLNDSTLSKCRTFLYGNDQIDLPVSPLSIACQVLEYCYELDPTKKIFTFGGDHSISYATTKSWIGSRKKRQVPMGIIHFDAHTDLLKDRMGVDICFGSWTYHILKDLPSTENIYQIGIRASAKDKSYWKKETGVSQIWAEEFSKEKLSDLINQVIAQFKKQKIEEIFITLDIDALDIQYADATGTPESGGLAPYQIIEFIKALAGEFHVTGGDIAEVAPYISHQAAGHIRQGPSQTIDNACNLISEILEQIKN